MIHVLKLNEIMGAPKKNLLRITKNFVRAGPMGLMSRFCI